jgi:hypothetical protein
MYCLGQFVMTMRKYLNNIQHKKKLFLGFPMDFLKGNLNFPYASSWNGLFDNWENKSISLF